MKRAFTLIELLVVIAIIAILAAILFPVFAQAKVAANKSVAISNFKQQGTATMIYSGDYDDALPQGNIFYQNSWIYNRLLDTPYNWRSAADVSWRELGVQPVAMAGWANATQAYSKSYDILDMPGQTPLNRLGYDLAYTRPAVKPANVGMQFNGLLGSYSASNIASPSQLTMYGQTHGREVIKGFSYSSPFMYCFQNAECRFQPSTPTCKQTFKNGEVSVTLGGTYGSRSRWTYGHGSVFVMADTSAHFKQMGMNMRASSAAPASYTDFKKDPFYNYDSNGAPGGEWLDGNACHVMLYQPDFDFQTWGSPVPASRQNL